MMMMVDIGNTNTVYALYNGENCILNKRIAPDQNIDLMINQKVLNLGQSCIFWKQLYGF